MGRHAREQLAELIAGAAPLRGDFFRSVAFKYFHPDDVVSGEGTLLHGGRFVPVGVRAVYASADEETAMREVTARKSALSGRKQIPLGEYPRMTYVLSVATRRNLNLAGKLPRELANVVKQYTRSSPYSPSQELAAIWIADGVESVVFPSATGAGNNVAIYLANAARRSVAVRNRDQVLAALRRPQAGKRSRDTKAARRAALTELAAYDQELGI